MLSKNWLEFYVSDSSEELTITKRKNPIHTETILLLENNPIQSEITKNQLKYFGFNIIQSDNTADAYKKIQSEPPEVLIMSLDVLENSEIEFISKLRIRFNEAELPIILLISLEKSEKMFEYLEIGINDFLITPCIKEKLYARVLVGLKFSKLAKSYHRFFPSEFIHLLKKKNISDLRLGDHRELEISVLFSDIRGFTKISEKLTPDENFLFLNSYLKRVGPIVRKHTGFIDKYIGDAIMALFPKSADDAVRSAIEIQNEVREFNWERRNTGEDPIKVGIGIHYGSVILGTIGEDERMEGTVVSDSVNLTSRLENLTKLYDCNILISMDTFLNLDSPEDYNFRILDRVKVKGKEQFVTVIEIIDGLPPNKVEKLLESKLYFEEGVTFYLNKQFEEAIEKFNLVLKLAPEDNATKIYIQRSNYYKNFELPKDWDGVEILEDKYY
ncbi:MAG: adenylate/guanylate cyclase domain-containing protein [Leptospiraceae bacterium]|nr:adenylate/guanylate cyclase domain-containing protein [Leptospiraceae bacterium]